MTEVTGKRVEDTPGKTSLAADKGPRDNKLTKCLERAQSLPNGRGSVKCAFRAARVSKRLGLKCTGYFFAASNSQQPFAIRLRRSRAAPRHR